MIFVTVGSQKFQFNRLLQKIDDLIDQSVITEEVFAQIGASDYTPKHYEYVDFMDGDSFLRRIEYCDVLITHGGTGVIINAIKRDKKVIAIPRLARYGEHVDDHQIQLLKEFKDLALIYVCEDADALEEGMRNIKSMEFNKFESHTEDVIEDILAYLGEV